MHEIWAPGSKSDRYNGRTVATVVCIRGHRRYMNTCNSGHCIIPPGDRARASVQKISGWHPARGLNSGHRTLQQWPQLRHPWPWPGRACGQWTQQWPPHTATVATVEASVAMAGARTRPVDSTVATKPINSGHSSTIRDHGRRSHPARGLHSGHRGVKPWPQLRHPRPWPGAHAANVLNSGH